MRVAIGDPRPWAWRLMWLIPISLAIGVVGWPDIHERLMPLSVAVVILIACALAVVADGRLRLLIILPVVAAYLPSAMAGFIAQIAVFGYFAVEYGAARITRPLDTIDWCILSVVAWCVLSWLVNLGAQTDLWALPVYSVTFLCPWLLLFVARAAPWRSEELSLILGWWIALAAVQAAPALLKPIWLHDPSIYLVALAPLDLLRVPGFDGLTGSLNHDQTTGTMISGAHLGVLLVLLLVLVSSYRYVARSRWQLWALAGIGVVFLMTATNHAILAAAIPGAIYLWHVQWPRWQRRTRRRIAVGLAVGVLLLAGYAGITIRNLVVNGFWRPYVALAGANPKVRLFTRTAVLLGKGNMQTWVGYGPGALGSRAASIRATDILFKEENRLPSFIPPYTSPAYASVAYDVYTASLVETARFRSGALGNPFSSVLGVVAELGIVGTVLLLAFLAGLVRLGFRAWRDGALPPTWRAAGATLGFALPFLLVLGIFDSYFEQPDVTGPIAILALVVIVAWERRSEPASHAR